jgi:[ribosomal protein S5]-alanine N-acetyltransferase
MPAIELLSITPILSRVAANPSELERAEGARLGKHADLVAVVVAQGDSFHESTGAAPQWGGFLAVDVETRAVVGTCAFKGAPDADGEVEIAYFTFPAFERQGYGTAMAAALVARAIASGQVRTACALTLPEPSASTRILERQGFVRAGTSIDDEAGLVWRWERSLDDKRGDTSC